MPPQESIRAPDSRIPHDGSTNVAAANPASEIEMSESVPIRPANEEDSRNETTAMDSYYRPYFRNETSDSPAPNTPTSYTLSPEILAKYNLQNEYPFMDFDDFLPILGEFGRYQKILFFTMIPFAFFVAFVYFTQIFITLVPDRHWCKVPQLRDMPLHERLELAIPKTENGDYEKCLVYDMDWLKVMETNGTPKADPSWRKIPCPSGWEYDTTDLPYTTISTELNWVCDKAALPHIAQAIFFCGAICGGLIFGWMADRYGRIPALISANLLGFVGGVMTASTLNFWQFALCRFVVGFAFDNCFTMMYIVVLEYVGPKWRTFVANMSIAIFFTTASCLLPWLSYFIASWRWICIATGFPLAIAILTPIVVPESARWLVSRGRLQEAVAIIRSFERINRADVKQKHYSQFIDSCIKLQKEEEAEKSYSVLDLFKTPRLRKITLLLIFIWMAISLVFDGHVRNVSTLGMNVFITFTIASATEFPADTFLTMVLDRWGRRWLACGSMVVSGIFSLLATTVPTGVPSASLAILGRFSVNISYNIGLQYAAELLPTVVRARGVALIHIMGYVASILSPFVVYLATINPSLPLLVLGTLGIIGGILALFLPETMDRDLPQTLADGENFGKDQKFFNVPCFQKKEEETPAPNRFKRDTCTNTSLTSIRASTRGELYRSSIINRSSRKSKSQSNDQSHDQSHREQVV